MKLLWLSRCPAVSELSTQHTIHRCVYTHEMGIKENGKLAIMAGAGPMGLGALTYALHRDVRPSMVVVTDINQDRLDRAEELFPVDTYKRRN